MSVKLIAQAIGFLLSNVQWKSRGPALSEINHHSENMARVARNAR
jgi:hypothetical protein